MKMGTIKKVHKMLSELTKEHLDKIYDMLNVNMPIESYDAESFYSGVVNFAGHKCQHEYHCPSMIKKLLSKLTEPVSIEGDCVWTKGNGKPMYVHTHNGIMTITNKSHHYFGYPPHLVKGKLLNNGTYGLGVTINMAVKLWGKKVIGNLPKKV